jgi:hypothetical protein
MTFKDEAFTVPLTTQGDVTVGGIVQEELVDEETARTIRTSLGDPASVVEALHGDQRIPLMVTTGVMLPE